MRIVSGSLGGRTFEAPRGHRTHPMSDKVRGAIFNMLGDIEDLTVLDAFAGSGALALEAISRGVARATAIEVDKAAAQTISGNAAALGVADRLKVIRASVSGWSEHNPEVTFDLILADPPYDDLQLGSIEKLPAHVASDGLLVLSWPGGTAVPAIAGLRILSHKTYGDAQLIFYKHV